MSQVSSVLNVDGVSTITSDEERGPDNHEGPSSNDQDRLSNTSLASRPPSSIVLTSDIQSSDAVQQPTLNIQDGDRPDGSANIRTLNSPQSPPSYWEPIWLSKVTLICATILFLLLGIGILVLYVVSSENEGLGPYTTGGDSVYLWRYIPTIGRFLSATIVRSWSLIVSLLVVVMLLALWNGTDFHARLLQPWSNLRKGPSPGHQTLFLDLISPILPSIAFSVIKTKAWAPMITTMCLIFLSIIVSYK